MLNLIRIIFRPVGYLLGYILVIPIALLEAGGAFCEQVAIYHRQFWE